MSKLLKEILDRLSNPFILTDEDGRIVRMNESADSIFRLSGHSHPMHVRDIDPALNPARLHPAGSTALKFGKTCRKVFLFQLASEGRKKEYLYLFDTPEILKKMDFDVFLDYIDDAIVIADGSAVKEHVNRAARELTAQEGIIGASLKDELQQGMINESATLKVLTSKQTEKTNVRYSTGRALTYTSIPYFNRNGEIVNVINTGRDITKLVQLQEDLHKTESIRDSYYHRLSTLESLVGSDTIIHASEAMKRVASLAIKAGKSDSSVFIWGESGVGKERIASLIHKSSNRMRKPFIGINCSAIPSELLEAELFGYEGGAFTSARKGGKRGLFQEVKDGTLFLDEITELPFPMQSKLLRALQEREFMRIGGSATIPLRARILSSSNLNKDQLADASRFRRDLFYRLNVIPIFVPPLRERREDILPLVRFFLKNMNLKYKTNVRLNMNLMTRLYNYDWPGNVRELKNIIERLIVTAEKDEVDTEDYQAVSQLEEHGGRGEGISVSNIMPLKKALHEVERILTEMAFREAGTVHETARILQVAPSTIYRKIEKGIVHLK